MSEVPLYSSFTRACAARDSSLTTDSWDPDCEYLGAKGTSGCKGMSSAQICTRTLTRTGYRGTSRIRKSPPRRTAIGPYA